MEIMKVITMQDYLTMKRESEILARVKAEAKREKKEKVKKAISFFAGIILYWIACIIITMGFFAVALYTL
jgi:purine-cytosine permease-like protein